MRDARGRLRGHSHLFADVAWDEAFRRTREDADLRYQLQARRIPVYYEPEIRVFHHCRRTLRAYLAQFFGYGRGEFHLRRNWHGSSPPYRYASATTRRALRSLIRTFGWRRACTLHALLWLRRQAATWGSLYEEAAWKAPRHPLARWARFGRLLLRHYAQQVKRVAQRTLGQASARPSAQNQGATQTSRPESPPVPDGQTAEPK